MTLQTELLSTAARMIETAAGMIDMAKTLGGDATGATPTPTTANAFPADPGAAPFPSPENSTIRATDTGQSGSSYVLSKLGAVWKFDTDASGKLIPLSSEYGKGFQVSVNDQPIKDVPVNQILVRQGDVWFMHEGTVWGKLQAPDAPNSGIANGAPPPAWTTSPAGDVTVQLPAMPTPPAPSVPAPGSTGRKITFGTPTADHPDLQSAHDAANPGDTLVFIGSGGTVKPWTLAVTKPLLIDGAGRVTKAGQEDASYTAGLILDVSSLDHGDSSGYPHELGAIVPMTDCIIRGLRIVGCGMKEPTHGGTAAIRMGGPGNLTVDHCDLEKNQDGIGPSGFPHTMTVTNTILLDNGLGPNDGGSHNVYAANGPGGGCVSAVFGPGFTSIVTQGGGGGHAVKSRANVTNLVAPFYIYAADSSTLDLPDGSTQVVQIGAGTIAKKPGDANHVVIGYGAESQINGLAGVSIAAGATLDLQCDSPIIQTLGDMAIEAGVIFKGTKPSVQGGGTVKGLPA